MKKRIICAVFLCIFVAVSAVSFAEGDEKSKGDKKMRHKGMMMKKMMQSEMVATSDGGVIVLSRGKLVKYDANLNVVKEVEAIPGMKEWCEKMKSKHKKAVCSKCGGPIE